MSSAHPRAAVPSARLWTLRRRVAAAFALLAVLLVVLTAVTASSLINFANRGQEVIDRWEPAAATSQSLVADLVNQETGIRGYALSGRPEFLQPYSQYTTKQAADAALLRHDLHGHAGALDRLRSFEQAVDDWRLRTAEPLIALVRTNDPRASSQVDNDEGKARFDAVRTRGATLGAAVRALGQRAQASRRHAKALAIAALSTAAGLVALAGLFLWRGLHRWVLVPVERLAEQTRDLTAGDLNRPIAVWGPPEFVHLGRDVDLMRQRVVDELARAEVAREELIARSAELTRSNDDLEQFAYVASHDLSEPLRKVSNFCQLLERQYSSQLDDKARQYIDFAVDGAKRMQTLINDLLGFSRVGRTTEDFVEVDLSAVMASVVAELSEEIAASGAVISYAGLPTVRGAPALLDALLANLVGNALKYRGTDPPRVAISAERADDGWLFTVTDNGIGIEPQYADRIFAIFQRLHLRDEYGGTGIGLALCRKIVEFHGGRIWLDSDYSATGATFRFTLPEEVHP
jgi:signal transduction histidine kinase